MLSSHRRGGGLFRRVPQRRAGARPVSGGAPSRHGPEAQAARKARVLRALAAVLAGNTLYFLLLTRVLPTWARHRPFGLDPGLLVDFVVCLGIYLGLGTLGRRRG
jgi:hypothetical protein